MSKTAKRLLAAGTLGVPLTVAVVVVVASSAGGGALSPSKPAGEATAAAQGLRTVLVSSDRMPSPSEPGSSLRALRLSGRVPSRTSAGTVLTDEDCAPDARGVSRCVNRIRIAGGAKLSVRHPHRMMEVPCLSPGERVTVRPA